MVGIRLALTGPFFSGKTSIAHCLRGNYEFDILDYTGYLKELAEIGFRAMGKEITRGDIDSNKNFYRPYLQNLGECLGFDKGYGVEDLWMKHSWNLGFTHRYVFDNVRFLPQLEPLLNHNFRLVRVQCSPDTQARRALKLGVKRDDLHKWLSHPAEAGIPNQDGEILIKTDNNSVESCVEEIMSNFNSCGSVISNV